MNSPQVLWWGRFDPGYSRNRILRTHFAALGWQVQDFRPRLATLGDWEAALRRQPHADLVWVPCFRQRDLAAASRWARKQGIPLIFDPLISSYDKQVDERAKLDSGSARAQRLLAWERALFRRADRLTADTPAHADYFAETFGVDRAKIDVIYVGAEETLFRPQPLAAKNDTPCQVLFYGSFIPLQGPQVVVDAARLYQGVPVQWVLLGAGPLRADCEARAKGLSNLIFEEWLPYEKLPERILQADILLGVFGTTPKAGRVIPNKVFQALACGRPVVTRSAGAYPEALQMAQDSGIEWVPAGETQALADKVAVLASDVNRLRRLGEAAARTSGKFFSAAIIRRQLEAVLEKIRT